MKTKLSAIEELRSEKKQLINECREDKERLLHNLTHAQSNMGRFLLNSLFLPNKSKESDIAEVSVSGKKKENKKSGIGQMAISMAPLAWEIAQPILIGFAIKKVKSIFTKNKKGKS